jgi:hypothetical protein
MLTPLPYPHIARLTAGDAARIARRFASCPEIAFAGKAYQTPGVCLFVDAQHSDLGQDVQNR